MLNKLDKMPYKKEAAEADHNKNYQIRNKCF